jgi:hypothetical protein
MNRKILCENSLVWLKNQQDYSLPNVITGIPDIDELNVSIDKYFEFFDDITQLLMNKVKPDCYIIFIQTDRKYNKQWIDKSTLLNNIAKKNNIPLLWHKIVLNRPVNSTHIQRPTYSHFMCYSKTKGPGLATPDIIDGGKKLYKNATSLNAAVNAVKFILGNSNNDTILDPFVGQGTIVAVANEYNLNAIGIDINPEQCEKSKLLVIK